MRLKPNKTYSQHELAVKLHMEKPDRNNLLFWEHRHLIINAAKTAVAAALAWWIAKRLGMPDGYWASISSVIVLQSNVGSTIQASRNRFIGTAIGATVGIIFSLYGVLPWNYILAVIVSLSICGLLGMANSLRISGVTVSIVMLVESAGHVYLAWFRVSEVFLGIVTALAISTLILPDRARLRLRDGLAQEFLVESSYFEAILEGFGGAPSKKLSALSGDVSALLKSNNQLLLAARSEPSGGEGWREGLSMLSQFGRSLFDALRALELAVQGSHEDGYAQQLEPELGKLALHIRNGFHHVAFCIHEWNFAPPPPEINLEQDILDLEARMDSVRHKGVGFSQAEILRAYAVQLHLKQVARILRASRVETLRAVGTHEEETSSDSQ
jgi:uncharacterized membrane protein YccC